MQVQEKNMTEIILRYLVTVVALFVKLTSSSPEPDPRMSIISSSQHVKYWPNSEMWRNASVLLDRLEKLSLQNLTVQEYMAEVKEVMANSSTDVKRVLGRLNQFAEELSETEHLCARESFNSTYKICQQTDLRKFLAGYMYPVMLAVCVVGNSLNVAVYTFEFMRKSLAVKILLARALANTIFVLLLIFEAMKTLMIWDPVEQKELETVYWQIWPYFVMTANVFGSSAMWITVFMTLERYLYVIYPVRSKVWCTDRKFLIALISIIFCSTALHPLFPMTWYTEIESCSQLQHITVAHDLKVRSGLLSIGQIYHWASLMLAVLIPMSLMILMSIAITWKLNCRKQIISKLSKQKRCLTVITLSTTFAHLILEWPSVVVFTYAALGIKRKNAFFCTWSTVSNFLAMCNASVLFFIYLACSEHFRYLFLMRLKCRDGMADFRAISASPQQAAPVTRRAARTRTFEQDQAGEMFRNILCESTALLKHTKTEEAKANGRIEKTIPSALKFEAQTFNVQVLVHENGQECNAGCETWL